MGKVKVDRNQCEHSHYLHYGSGLPVFRGDAHQRGYGIGNVISGLFRSALPVITPMLKAGAKSLAKTAFSTGRNVLSDVISDRRTLEDSLKKRVSEALHVAEPSQPSQLPKKRRKPMIRRSKPRKRRDIFGPVMN